MCADVCWHVCADVHVQAEILLFLQALVAATPYFSELLKLRVIIFLSDADRESIFS